MNLKRLHPSDKVWKTSDLALEQEILQTHTGDQPKSKRSLSLEVHGEVGRLIRNHDQLTYFADERCIGDFFLNVANALTADYLVSNYGLERLTASYDLHTDQLEDLPQSVLSHWFEITLHQHMPMFHMEHCVFWAFLSDGKDFRDCGRPCETIKLNYGIAWARACSASRYRL